VLVADPGFGAVVMFEERLGKGLSARKLKSEIRNPKHETNSKFKYQMTKTLIYMFGFPRSGVPSNFVFRSFGFVSDFDIRYLNLSNLL